MELDIIGLLLILIGLARVIMLKVLYVKSYALCLDYHTSNWACGSYPLFEYEMIESGEKVIYRNWGTAFFWPKKGKTYKVLINKEDHNKIVGYNEYVVWLFLVCLITFCLI